MLITYKVIMYMKRYYCFGNIHTPDDGPRPVREYYGAN